jgi:hypothetical protein
VGGGAPRPANETSRAAELRGRINLLFGQRFSLQSSALDSPLKEDSLARKTVLVCDNCGKEVDEGKGATMRMTFSDARRGAKEADLCDSCATGMPGRATARRGRRPKAVAA